MLVITFHPIWYISHSHINRVFVIRCILDSSKFWSLVPFMGYSSISVPFLCSVMSTRMAFQTFLPTTSHSDSVCKGNTAWYLPCLFIQGNLQCCVMNLVKFSNQFSHQNFLKLDLITFRQNWRSPWLCEFFIPSVLFWPEPSAHGPHHHIGWISV